MNRITRLARSALGDAAPDTLSGPVRAGLTEQRRLAALRTILRADVFDQEWYEAQTGLTFGSVERACWHYVRKGRSVGHSPHPLFEPSVAWPNSFDNDAALDPLARHLGGQSPASGIVHPALAPSWGQHDRGRPRWLRWADDAEDDSVVPLTWADPATPLTWSAFRRQALERARETQRMRQLRRDIRPQRALPAAASSFVVPAPRATAPDPAAPLVSIVMPTWNRAPLLRAAVASVAAQTLTDWELIVVDDGSDDDTLLVLEGLARHDSRIHVVPMPHGGVCRARNSGIAAARGRWLAFLDSDNTWEPDFLHTIIGFAEAENAPWAHAAMKLIGEDGVRYRGFEGTREHLLVGNHIDLNVLVALRDVVDQVGGFDESLRRAVDYDLVLRLSNTAPPRFAPFVGANYANSREDDQRISVAEAFTWNSVVAQRHLIDLDAERRRERVAGRVSIVVPILNRVNDAAELITALRHAAADQEIVVVVAGQSQSLARALSTAALGVPDISVVYWSADLNWAACIGFGATYATGEYLVAWRPNCLPVPGWWEPLRRALEDPSIAIVQPLTLMRDGRISSAGATFVRPDPFPSPLLAGFPIDDARPLGLTRVPAAYAGVLAVRADDFWSVGGLDSIFGNALGEVDLSLRAEAEGVGVTAVVTDAQVIAREPRQYRLAPDLSASAKLMRLRHSDPPSSDEVWKLLDFEVIGRRAQSLPAHTNTPVEMGATPVVRPVIHEHPRQLRWALDIAAPAGPKGLLWGDLHFANSLAASLRRLGQQVHVDFREARMSQHRDLDDVTVVLRGLDLVAPRPGGLSLMWIISHPDLVTEPECAAYAKVFAASTHWAQTVSARWGFTVEPLLQCTDADLFRPDAAAADTGDDVVFVGNSRKVQRLSVKYAIDAGMKPVVWGGGWSGVIPDDRIAGEYVPNAELPALYAAAGVVLSDHWDDMRHEGFIANRIFDVLASGGRLLSDDVTGLADLFGSAVPLFHSEHDVKAVFAGDWRTHWPDREQRLALAEKVRSEHSFDSRARTLLEVAMRQVVLPDRGP